MATSASIGIHRGRITFEAEGDNYRHSRYFTRVIHYPERGLSGVTIGRGYDMSSRSRSEVYLDLTWAGVDSKKAQAISMAARLTGSEAAKFVKRNRDIIGEITESQQVNLFNQIYPIYERRAQSAYYAKTADIKSRPDWYELHPAIRDVLVDIVYQGYAATDSMPAATKNDINYMINFIREDKELRGDEAARNRAGYLEAYRGRSNQ